jgi:hypothetical protein
VVATWLREAWPATFFVMIVVLDRPNLLPVTTSWPGRHRDDDRLTLWVPETPQTSRDLLILVDEPAEAVVSFDLVDLGCGVTGEWSCGSGLPQGAVRPVIVVVAFEFV